MASPSHSFDEVKNQQTYLYTPAGRQPPSSAESSLNSGETHYFKAYTDNGEFVIGAKVFSNDFSHLKMTLLNKQGDEFKPEELELKSGEGNRFLMIKKPNGYRGNFYLKLSTDQVVKYTVQMHSFVYL